MAPMIATMKVNEARMAEAVRRDFSNATDLADYLVRKGLPFRQAHEVVGRTVLYCLQQGKVLLDLTLDEFCQFCDRIEADVYDALAIERVVAARNSLGGTAPEQVRWQIGLFEEKLAATRVWIEEKEKQIAVEL